MYPYLLSRFKQNLLHFLLHSLLCHLKLNIVYLKTESYNYEWTLQKWSMKQYYLRQKNRIALEESWFIVARSVQIHSLDVPDFLCVLYDPPAPPWPPSSSLALIHTACWGSCALCLSRLVRRWLKLQWPLPTLITALYGFRIEQTTRDSETVLSSLQSECNRDSVALFV